MASLRFLGHSTFQLELAGRKVLFDPFLDPSPKERNRLVPPATTQEGIRRCDVICISSESFDHCSPYDVAAIVSRTNAHVVAPVHCLSKLDIPSRLKVSAEAGDRFSLLGLDIEVFPANLPRSQYAVGYVLRGEGKTLYFSGSTYEFSQMRQLECDVAILPIGGTFSMDAIGAVNALKSMRAKYVVPCQYNTFDRIAADVADFSARVKRSARTTPVALDVGQAMDF